MDERFIPVGHARPGRADDGYHLGTTPVNQSGAFIAVVSLLAVGLNIDTRTVGDITSIQKGFPPFHIPIPPISLDTPSIIFSYALIVASVGLIESLLTLNLIDEITGTR